MKSLLIAAATGLLATTALTGPSLAQQGGPGGGPGGKARGGMFERADANNDGKITPAEFNAARDKRFAAMDRNKDGAIDRTEIRAYFLARLEERRQRRQARRIERMGGQDGKLTEQQFLENAKKRFQRLDANKDGVLTADELRAGRQGMRARFKHRHRAMRRGGYGRRGYGRRGFRGGRLFRMADANRDGRITKAEFDAVGAYMFLRRDLNGDGVIERAEAPRFGVRHRGHRGRGGHFGRRGR